MTMIHTVFVGVSLVMVFMYGMVFFYLYALISFGIYRDLYSAANGEFCGTMFQCYVTILHRGLITGLYDVGLPKHIVTLTALR